MKLLSSSSSSSSTVSFDKKMCTSTSATAGCLSGILRRILCSTSLPTHPSDHTTEEANSVASFNKQEQLDDASSKVTPGIVARLMGLDSLPELHPNSITRSRSMNSADYKQDTGSIHGKHRRVNSTLSFRDMPAYFEMENEEFFVLSFEKRSERKSKEGKSKGGSGELKQRKENKENQGEKVAERKIKEDNEQASTRVLTVLDEENMNRRMAEKPNWEMAKCMEANDLCLEKKKKKIQHPGTKNVEPECSSEDSSPVSVLVFDQFINDHHVPTTEEDSKAAQGSNPRRKLSPDLENYECKPPCNDGNLMEDGGRENNIEVKNLVSIEKDCHSERNLEDWDANAICRLIEADVAKSSWSCTKSNTEELEDITADLGSKILDQLLDELLIQFSVSFPCEI